MVKSTATTVAEYLATLPEDRRDVVTAVLDVVRKNLPTGYSEGINWGMIAFEVPLARYPNTYNKEPLSYAGLAAQKKHFSLYLNCIDAGSAREDSLRAEFEKSGKTLDMGKACIRFTNVEDLDLDAIGRVIAETPVDAFIARYEASRKKT
jgi:uncharacterized protein YdhG (YjbR/CyaY superfamily)